MSIYVAGKFTSKERIAGHRDALVRMGFAVSSTWLTEPETDYTASIEYKIECANRDLEEVEAASMLIIDTLDESITGGREIEMGYALSRGIPVYVVGPPRNVFHYIANGIYPDWDALLEHVAMRGFY